MRGALTVLFLAGLIIVSSGCGGQSGDESKIKASFKEYVTALVRGDAAGACALTSGRLKRSMTDETDQTCETVYNRLAARFGGDDVIAFLDALGDASFEVDVRGDRADLTVQYVGETLPGRVRLVRAAGEWFIDDGAAKETATAPLVPGGSLETLWRTGKPSIGATPGTSDHGPGLNRISFLVVDNQSRLIEAPVADLWLSRTLKGTPYAKTVARLVTIGVPGGEAADVQRFYVATVRLPGPGKVWYVAAPRGTGVRALGNLLVGTDGKAPTIGDRAVPSATPTLRSTKDDLTLLTTSRKPNRALYETSVKEAMAAGVPFVVTFATPLFCQTRLCGPVVDVVGAVQKQFAHTDVKFIHAEVYEDNDPANDVNAWMDEWRLPTEPWTFVVNARGRVVARYENAMSTAELVAAVRKVAR